MKKSINKVLIANRGEIANRIIKTCNRLGIRTVTVFSDADANSQHVKNSHESYYIGKPAASESYLRIDKIIDVAKKSGANAIHPGYGFLSENPKFAQACEDTKIIFIGPPSKAILDMGSKSASKNIMEKAGVPCTPGYHGEDQSMERLVKEANKCGFPLMLKAFKGGGGKGMRIVEHAKDFERNADACRREALSSFGDDRILLERYIRRPRHIEFQIFGDKHGNAIHLHERDCSVQRRHQKVLEESPAPFMTEDLRSKMGATAVAAAKAVGYVGAGTVEFMLDEDGTYYFMEMNTRLQVEHPVTEMVTGVDLVEWQIRVASGEPLPIKSQKDVRVSGHALEARVYAENAEGGFLPGSGTLTFLRNPSVDIGSEKSVRVETGVIQGDEVTIFYDPMISKLVVHAPDRAAAMRLMVQKLNEYKIGGLTTNIDFLRSCVIHPKFQEGGVNTSFLDKHLAEVLNATPASNEEMDRLSGLAAIAQVLLSSAGKQKSTTPLGFRTHGDAITNYSYDLDVGAGKFRSVKLEARIPDAFIRENPRGTKDNFVQLVVSREHEAPEAPEGGEIHGHDKKKKKKAAPTTSSVTVEGSLVSHDSSYPENIVFNAKIDGEVYNKISAVWIDNTKNGTKTLHLFTGGNGNTLRRLLYRLNETKEDFSGTSGGRKAGTITAPMPGKIVRVMVKDGDKVKEGDQLVIVLAMKMEHSLNATKSGTITSLSVKEGDFVDDAKVLLSIS